MVRFLKQITGNEKGQALPVVLALLALGSLIVVPSLNYANTSLNSGQNIEESVKGIYAADAGVEDALWCLENSLSPPLQLPENINQMAVAIQTEDRGTYTLYLGELVGVEHHAYLLVGGEMVWDKHAAAYEYTITVTWTPDSGSPSIHLDEVGVRLPLGYSYQSGSAASFADNLSTAEPEEIADALGGYMLNWVFESPKPDVTDDDPVATQTFYITGEGSQDGDYTWVVASSGDIGVVGEFTGTLYTITATATHPVGGEITAQIVADVMLWEETTDIIAWQVLK